MRTVNNIIGVNEDGTDAAEAKIRNVLLTKN